VCIKQVELEHSDTVTVMHILCDTDGVLLLKSYLAMAVVVYSWVSCTIVNLLFSPLLCFYAENERSL
jgi:hypothetical protein